MSVRAVVAGVAALIGLCFTAVSPSMASAGLPGEARAEGAPKLPKLEITIDNSSDQVTAGRDIVYTINVRNQTGKDLSNVVISQMFPTSLTQVESEPKPTDAETNQVQWTARIPAGQEALIVMTGKIGALSAVHRVSGKPKLTTTACVAADLKSPVTACASESDVVVAAAEDSSDADRIILPAALLGAVCCGGGGYLWYRRRRSQEPQD